MTTEQVSPVVVDEATFGRLLLRIESDVHRGGWEQRPSVFILIDADGHQDTAMDLLRFMRTAGPSIRVGGFMALTMIAPLYFARTPGTPWEALRNFALNVAYADHPQPARLREVLRVPGVIGAAAAANVWGHNDPEVRERVIAGEVQVADVPGAFEARRLTAVTTDGRIRTVTRVRGRKPQLDGNEDDLRGDISTSLRILCDTISGNLPAREDFDSRYPTLAQLVEQKQ